MAKSCKNSSQAVNAFAMRRQPGLDAARGIAVLGMAAVHFLAAAAEPTNAYETFWDLFHFFWKGKASATFCVLAGITWSFQVQRGGGLTAAFLQYYLRRILGLTSIGLAFAFTYWHGQILTYFALYMVFCLPLLQARRRTILATMFVLLALTPVLQYFFGHFTEPDWFGEEYGHIAAWDFGWGSLRYLFFDGEFPVVPWLIYPLAGILIGRVDWNVAGRARRLFLIALPIAVLLNLYTFLLQVNVEMLGSMRPYLGLTWRPTTFLFPLYGLSSALTVLGLLLWLQQASSPLFRLFSPFKPVGRLALTHYLLHIYLGLVLLDLLFPKDSWPVWVGAGVWMAYCGSAIIFSTIWLKQFKQGPAEWLLRKISGQIAGRRPSSSSVPANMSHGELLRNK